jgi:hypothetical protein
MLTTQPNRPFCQNCKISLSKPNGFSVAGFQKWHKYCAECAKAAYNPKFGYLVEKKNYCEECGFTAKDKCQLDVVYKDGDRKNKSTNNIKTICANCYRLLKKLQKQSKKSILDITVDTDATI